MNIDITEITKILPHRYPFLLVDRVVGLEVGKSIEAYKNITINEEIFQGHFPDHPIYPGVMIVEGLAQAGGILAFKSLDEEAQSKSDEKVVYFTAIDKCKFRTPVKPGDKLEYKIEVIKNRGAMWVFNAQAFVDGKLATQAELKAMIVDK